ncbi:Predicted arabinose efflux permease, MFS family [Picrophilus oshimae DSM 9789]|uniref:Predicted arabinose efflux permease, MFS family n=2 Tax=Picrophilus oshimae TaxID=46632 RepID=A0A8G2L6Q2_PICTO|nr:Predicted arabinose efflux permease, MFS family [Picrophilus oshimae DSM 9789]
MAMDYRARAAGIHAARAIYALNWMDMAPALSYIKSYLNINIVYIGFLVSAFYLGISVFQILGGYLSSRIGDKNISFIGLFLVGFFAIASGLSSNFPELILSRFFAGFSAALFFSPALSVLASIVPEDRYTFHIGAYNGSFNLGAGIGVIGWGYLDMYLNYRTAFIIAGIITFVILFFNVFINRETENIKSNRSMILKDMTHVILSPLIFIIALASIASMVSETIMGQFFVYYLESRGIPPINASSISSIYLFIGFVGGILGGLHFSRTSKKFMTFALVNMITGFLLILISFVYNYLLLTFIIIILGMLTVYGFSISYTFGRYISRRDMVSVTLSIINLFQLLIAFILPVIFSGIVHFYNYEYAWTSMGIISIVFIPLIYMVKHGLSKRNASAY